MWGVYENTAQEELGLASMYEAPDLTVSAAKKKNQNS